jgi:aldose 1-epimerase
MKNSLRIILYILTAMLLATCSPSSDPEPARLASPESDETAGTQSLSNEEASPMEVFISESSFGTTADGEGVTLYTLQNRPGMKVEITNYGGTIVSLTAPDREGRFEDIVLGYESLAEYEQGSPYFGSLIGRYGNRIGKARFALDGKIHHLTVNDGPNHLHGGDRGFDKVVWDAQAEESENGPGLSLNYTSAAGEEGYPGTLSVTVRYTLTHDNRLVIEYEAQADEATPVNLTHHSYFNLAGNAERDILGHELEIKAEHFTPVDATLIPTGEIRPVAGTPFDFRIAKPIGRDIGADDEQIRFGLGYDHNWVVDKVAEGRWRHVATLSDPGSGRVMTVHSTEPGIQFYSGNFLDGSITGKGVVYGHRSGLCLETQHFPDSPNKPGFPDTILRPGEVYRTTTAYAFSTDR